MKGSLGTLNSFWCFVTCAVLSAVLTAHRSALIGQTSAVETSGQASFLARVEDTSYRGWHAYVLTNNIIRLFIAPDIGGRAIQLQLGGQSFFFVNSQLAGKVLPPEQNNLKAGVANYGGDKVWPAPEGWMNDDEWPSIPYYILDGSRFKSKVVTNTSSEVAVRVTSPEDPRTGVQLSRTFHVYAGTTRIRVDEEMRNISRREIRWGIWHLVQQDGSDARDPSKPNPDLFVYVPLSRHSAFPRGYYNPYGDARNPAYQLVQDGRMLRIHYLYRVGKVAADTDRGWYAVVNGQKNLCFVEKFKYAQGTDYPDHASFESWNDGPGILSRGPFDQILVNDPKRTPYFLESEVLSPYATLDPGEQYSFTVYWSPTRAPNPIQDAVWIGAISKPLEAKTDGKRANLKGVFGVFSPGQAVAVWYSKFGEILGQQGLGGVDPRQVFRLDKTIPQPPNAFRISVQVQDADGHNLGFLGNVVFDQPGGMGGYY